MDKKSYAKKNQQINQEHVLNILKQSEQGGKEFEQCWSEEIKKRNENKDKVMGIIYDHKDKIINQIGRVEALSAQKISHKIPPPNPK